MGIRKETLCPAQNWAGATADEVREVLRLAGLTGSEAASFLGLGPSGGRTVRRWTGGEVPVPYAVWALLCHRAGLGFIWSDLALPEGHSRVDVVLPDHKAFQVRKWLADSEKIIGT